MSQVLYQHSGNWGGKIHICGTSKLARYSKMQDPQLHIEDPEAEG